MRGQKRVEDARERAYAPRIHLLRKKVLQRWMDCIATRACPSCAFLCAPSPAMTGFLPGTNGCCTGHVPIRGRDPIYIDTAFGSPERVGPSLSRNGGVMERRLAAIFAADVAGYSR